jgi:hypothetical protein
MYPDILDVVSPPRDFNSYPVRISEVRHATCPAYLTLRRLITPQHYHVKRTNVWCYGEEDQTKNGRNEISGPRNYPKKGSSHNSVMMKSIQ